MSREIVVSKAVDAGDDVLVVTGTVDGVEVEARGWVSAVSNHYAPSDYGDDGHRKDDAKAKVMTTQEQAAYFASLLVAAVPSPAPEPKVLFSK